MVYFSKTYVRFPTTDSAYGDSFKLELLDGWRIRIEMDNCPNPDDCECPATHYLNKDKYLARTLSLRELKELRDSCTDLIYDLEVS